MGVSGFLAVSSFPSLTNLQHTVGDSVLHLDPRNFLPILEPNRDIKRNKALANLCNATHLTVECLAKSDIRNYQIHCTYYCCDYYFRKRVFGVSDQQSMLTGNPADTRNSGKSA